MAVNVDDVKSRALKTYQGFTPGQRTVTVLALIGLVMGGMMFARWAATPTMVPLFTSLTGEDAAGITEALNTEGVKYELADGGATILVPQDDVYDLRVSLSSEGLPAGDTVGYDLLDKQGITTSEAQQRIAYQRALEGELSKTITSIDGVEAATVHVVIPEEDLFTDDLKQPTASVLVRTAPGKSLESQQITAVVNLVASSVEGLAPTQVTLADSAGNVLSAPGEDGDLFAGDARNQQTSEFEAQLAASLETMLAKVVGSDGAVVEVNADLNFDTAHVVKEEFDDEKIRLSTAKTSEVYTGVEPGDIAGAGGALGPDGVPLTGDPSTTDYEKSDGSTQFAVGKVTSDIKTAPGDVEKLSVAVLLDDSAEADFGTGQIEALVTAAVGLDTQRGDTIEVTRLPFDRSNQAAAEEELDAAEAEAKSAETMGMIRTGVVVLVILLVLVLAYFSMRRATKPKATAVDISRLQPLLEAKAAEEQRQIRALEEQLTAARNTELELPPEVQERVAIHSEIVELIDSQPDEVASLLRGWLADRRS